MTSDNSLHDALFVWAERSLNGGHHILVAVSGGPDSLSLLHALHMLRDRLQLGGLSAAHFDHGLRGDESAADAAFVQGFCDAIGVTCYVGMVNSEALRAARTGSLQEAARDARYNFLESAADEAGATLIATAHTQDDQVETVLLNILRGAGIDGLRGIPERRGRIVRPLLAVSRSEIEGYCTANGLSARRDPTNQDPSHYLRNRIRLQLLPELAEQYHPGVRASLLRLSEIAAMESDYIEEAAAAALDSATQQSTNAGAFGSQLLLDCAKLTPLHPALQRRVIRLAALRVQGHREGLAEAHVEGILALAAGARRDAVNLPAGPGPTHVESTPINGMAERPSDKRPSRTKIAAAVDGKLAGKAYRVRRSAGTLVVEPIPVRSDLKSVDKQALSPDIGEVEMAGGWSIRVEVCSDVGLDEIHEQPNPFAATHHAVVDAGAVDIDSLVARGWNNGDRIAPLGMNGHAKKLQDLFTDAKIPRGRRANWPVIADRDGIVWVPALAVADRAKTTASTTTRLRITVGYRPS